MLRRLHRSCQGTVLLIMISPIRCTNFVGSLLPALVEGTVIPCFCSWLWVGCNQVLSENMHLVPGVALFVP